MYSFYYKDLLRKCGRENIELLFTDTGKHMKILSNHLFLKSMKEKEGGCEIGKEVCVCMCVCVYVETLEHKQFLS